MGARGERPVFFPCSQTSGTWLSGILEIPGVQKVPGGIRCTWDVAWAVARLLRLPEPQVPTHDGPLPGLERYRALKFHEKTYPRQKEDILFLARRAAAILAEPMRSGKTIMAIGASVLVDSRKTLVVCPEFARLGWADEIARWAREPALMLCGRGGREARLRCMTCQGRKTVNDRPCPDCRARNGQSLGCTIYDVPELRRVEGNTYRCPRHDVTVTLEPDDQRVARCRLCHDRLHQALLDARFIIVNYELLVRQHMNVGDGRVQGRADLAGWVEPLKSIPIDVCIADEAHMLRGWSTSKKRQGEARNERFLELVGTNRIPRVWMVTGTPFYGFVRDIFWLLECATGGLWGSDTRLRGRKFMVRYAGGVQTSRGFQAKDRTIYAETELMRRLLGTTDAEGRRNFDGLMVQRPREELFADVPPMQHQLVYLDLPEAPSHVTRRGREGISNAIRALNPLKTEALMDRFLDELAEGNKIVVFAFHVQSAKQTFLAFEKAFVRNDVRTRMREVNARAWLATGLRRKNEEGDDALTDEQKKNWATSGDQRYLLAEAFRNHAGAGVLVATIDALPGALSLRGASSVHFLDLHWSPGAIAQAENRPWYPEVKDLQVVYYVVRDTVDEYVAAEVLPKAETLARMGREAGAEAMLAAFGRQEEERTLESIFDRLTKHLRLDATSDAEDDGDL